MGWRDDKVRLEEKCEPGGNGNIIESRPRGSSSFERVDEKGEC